MRFIILVAICIFQSAIAQTKDCSLAKLGKFELNSPVSGKTIIQRSSSTQTETNDSLNIELSYDLTWVNACVYELQNRKIVKGSIKSPWQPNYKLIVEILKIQGDKIFIKTSSNYNDKIIERVITKLK